MTPENIFLKDEQYKIGAYGVVEPVEIHCKNRKIFTPPEYSPVDKKYTFKMDMYSLGMSVLSYATNYSTNKLNPTKNDILNDCINWCINPNPQNRPTTTELLNKLMTVTKSGIFQTIYQLQSNMEDPKMDIIMNISSAAREDPNNITLIGENNCILYLCESFKHTEDSDMLLEIISLLYFIYDKSI